MKRLMGLRMLLYVVLVGLGLFSVACSSRSKTSSETKEESKKAQEKSTEVAVKHSYIELRTTSCMGRCPVYTFKVYDDLTCEINAEMHFVVEGEKTGKLTEGQFKMLQNKLEQIDFFSLKNEYDDPHVQDVPLSFITVTTNGVTKKIKNRYDAPAGLREFQSLIDSIAREVKWK